MKRFQLLLVAVISMAVSNAQDITDGLRYSTDATTGTARFNAMSGAFGALGGDFSAIGINPAGSAVFLNNSASISGTVVDRENVSTYFGTERQSIDTSIDLNQAGIVFVFDDLSEDSVWKKFTIGLNYDVTQNHDDQLFIKGTGNTSIAEFFRAQAEGIPLDLLQLRDGESISGLYSFLGETEGTAAQNAFLGFQGFIIDPVDPENPSNTAYISNVAAGNFNQEYSLVSNGYNAKYTINFAAQYTENVFFGINLNSHSLDYDNRTFLYESNSNAGSFINEIGFENSLSARGSGFSAQAGIIAKVADNIRLGLSYDTPTWFRISEETTQYLETTRSENNQSITEVIDPLVLNIFEDYRLNTPGKISASGAYVFGKDGLISLDYSYKDYAQIKFRPSNDPNFVAENNNISNLLKAASTIKVGGEYRIKQLSVRGGFRYEESPYKGGEIVGDLTGFSFGLGYNFGNYNFDVSYARAEQSSRQKLFNLGLTDTAMTNTTFTNILFTLGFGI